MKNIYVFYGAPAVGKSKFVNGVLDSDDDNRYIKLDAFNIEDGNVTLWNAFHFKYEEGMKRYHTVVVDNVNWRGEISGDRINHWANFFRRYNECFDDLILISNCPEYITIILRCVPIRLRENLQISTFDTRKFEYYKENSNNE